MNLRDDTQNILSKVEEVTGNPVEVMRDPDLPFLARITRAKGGVPAHILRINPTKGAPDYLIAYEAGFILRLYANPPDDRYEFAGTDGGRTAVSQMVKRSGQTVRLPEMVASQLTTQLFDGLMTQLRSYPIGIRIDQWLHDEYPALHDLQAASIDQQQKDNLQALSPEVRSFAPKPVWEANVAMNAAYAVFCDRLLGTKQYAIPYRSTGLEKCGKRLLTISTDVPADPAHDRELVDAWAEELGLAGWYQWVPITA